MLKIYPVYLSFKNWNSRFFGRILLIALYVPLRQFNLLAFPYDYNIWLHKSKREDNNSVNDIKKKSVLKKIIIQELSQLYSGYVYDSTCPYFGGQKDKVTSFFADKRIYIIKEKEY